jgi:dolichol-phosphate mannosyltransferase
VQYSNGGGSTDVIELSVVIPFYRGVECLPELDKRLSTALGSLGVPYEILLVDDGSPDRGWALIAKLARENPALRAIQLSRNFGQHSAIHAGLKKARGEWTIVMDCDLQDRPEEIPALYAHAKKGWDVVVARRRDRRDSWLKKRFSALFYAVLSFLSETKQDASVANFGIYHRRVVDAVLSLGEQTQYFPVMVRWVGFRQTGIEVEHAARFAGESSYDFIKLFRLAVRICLAFSDRLLVMAIWFGGVVIVSSGMAAAFLLWGALTGHIHVLGWSSLMISIWMVCGILTTMTGIAGLYIARIFNETKQRPRFIIREELNG